MPTWPSPRSEQLGTPNPPRNPFHAGQVFRGFPIHAFATACQVVRSPVRIRPILTAPESFYFQASNGSVALPVAGYDYNSDWTPLLAGLSPARMAASLAAPEPYVRLSRIRLPPWVMADQRPAAVQRLVHLRRRCVRRACSVELHFPRPSPFAPPTPLPIARLCSPASSLLWLGLTSHLRTSPALAPHLPGTDR